VVESTGKDVNEDLSGLKRLMGRDFYEALFILNKTALLL
jgi:hypothetical protein